MPTGLETAPTEAPEFAGRIRLPYTLTAGRTAGIFLAELANRRIVGSRTPSGRVLVPAQDFDGETGEETEATLLELPSTGRITAFTETAAGVLALVRIDGADTDMVHRILDADHASLQIGQRVTARWADDPQGSMLDLAGFVLAADDGAPAPAAPRELGTDTEPIAQTPYELDLRYRHAYGPYYGRMFDELATSRRILGVRCPSCENVLVPPREFCELCFVRTGEWVDVADTGVLQAYSVIHLEFVGQTREPPYIYAEVILDGASTRLIHMIGGIDPEEAPKRLTPGARVRAVWREDATTGTLEDIEHFVLMEDR